ncbi:MAG: DUF4199 domain-containing protein [Pseudomonadota bacterium]
MLRYSFIYGAIIGAAIIAFMSVVLISMGTESLFSSELAGYAIMLVVLSLVFIGIKRYRDVEHGGVIKFTQAAGVGIGISAVAALMYTIGWEISLALTDYAFIEAYPQTLIDAVRAEGLAANEEAARIAEIESSIELYRNPLFRMPITFIEMFPVGLIVALVSALVLRNAKVLPAKANGASQGS